MATIRTSATIALSSVTALLALAEPALAQVVVPGPLAGAGLPFLLVGGGVYLLVRKYRRRNRKD